MKSYRPDAPQDPLLDVLCKHFRIDRKLVTYMEDIEMKYVYRFVAESRGLQEPKQIFYEIRLLMLPYRIRSKRKKLHQLFIKCQSEHMVASDNYDTSSMRAPVKHIRGHYY